MYRNRFHIKKEDRKEGRDTRKENFRAFNGGMAAIPDGRMDEFQRVYVKTVLLPMLLRRAPRPCYLIQCNTKVFPLFSDIDYKGDTELTVGSIEQVARVIHIATTEVYAGGVGPMYVLSAPPKTLEESTVKTGLHIYLPQIHVDMIGALRLRAVWLARLKRDLGDLEGGKGRKKWMESTTGRVCA